MFLTENKLFCILIFAAMAILNAQEISWQKVDEGLFFGEFTAFQESDIGDSKVSVLKIDPAKYDFNLLSAKEKGEISHTAEGWAKEKGLIAVINAGMFMADTVTNCGYMKNFDFVNNHRLNKDKTIVAFNRKEQSVPEFQIIDLQHQNLDSLKSKYNSFSQSIRMISPNQNNVWSKQEKIWSVVTIGKDKEGNALFIFCRSPYRMHDFINIILKSPLNVYNMMYLEGGPESSFYLNHNGFSVRRVGSYETGFNENDENNDFWALPNVIGITKK